MSLTDYITDTQAILHDANSLFTSQNMLVRYINTARRQLAKRTGCIQRMITGQSAFGAGAQAGSMIPGGGQPGAVPGALPNAQGNTTVSNTFNAIVGVERYPYQGFANGYLKDQHAGVKGVLDVLSVSVSWGSVRPSLAWMPYIDLQAYARAYQVILESYPYFWSTLNDGENGEVWLFPVPSFPMEMEWQVYCVPSNIFSDDDYDAIPDGFKEAVKFYAAGLAYLSKQQFLNAQLMLNQFADTIGVDRASVDAGKTPSFYDVFP